jgi:hypothetical protein
VLERAMIVARRGADRGATPAADVRISSPPDVTHHVPTTLDEVERGAHRAVARGALAQPNARRARAGHLSRDADQEDQGIRAQPARPLRRRRARPGERDGRAARTRRDGLPRLRQRRARVGGIPVRRLRSLRLQHVQHAGRGAVRRVRAPRGKTAAEAPVPACERRPVRARARRRPRDRRRGRDGPNDRPRYGSRVPMLRRSDRSCTGTRELHAPLRSTWSIEPTPCVLTGGSCLRARRDGRGDAVDGGARAWPSR